MPLEQTWDITRTRGQAMINHLQFVTHTEMRMWLSSGHLCLCRGAVCPDRRGTHCALQLLWRLLLRCPASVSHFLDLDVAMQLQVLTHNWTHVQWLRGRRRLNGDDVGVGGQDRLVGTLHSSIPLLPLLLDDWRERLDVVLNTDLLLTCWLW